MPRSEVFLDTSYAVSLAIESDLHHTAALKLSRHIEGKVRFVTTRAVLLEIGNTLARMRFRHGLIALLPALEADPDVEIVPLTEPLFARGVSLLRERREALRPLYRKGA